MNHVHASEVGGFSGVISAEIASAGIWPSSGLYDILPVSSQMLDWRQDIGGFGYLVGSIAVYSSIHDRQHEEHWAVLNEVDGDVCYGYCFDLCEHLALRTKIGPYVDVPYGYKSAHMKCWGTIFSQSLENQYVTPYWGSLWLLEPQNKGRVRVGLRKRFEIGESFALMMFAEGVWMDKRRFDLRYGGEPESDTISGGAVAFVLSGVRLDWKMSDNFSLYVAYTQYDVVNSQARRAVKSRGRYYDKCDWPIARIGVSYAF